MTRLPLVVSLFVLVGLTPDCAAAAEPQCDPRYPQHCEQRLAAGEAAAFAGHLLTPALALSLGMKAEGSQRVIDLEVEYARKELQLELTYQEGLRKSDAKAHAEAMAAMVADRDRWRRLARTPFYKEPWFVSTVTVVVVGAIFVGASR